MKKKIFHLNLDLEFDSQFLINRCSSALYNGRPSAAVRGDGRGRRRSAQNKGRKEGRKVLRSACTALRCIATCHCHCQRCVCVSRGRREISVSLSGTESARLAKVERTSSSLAGQLARSVAQLSCFDNVTRTAGLNPSVIPKSNRIQGLHCFIGGGDVVRQLVTHHP